MKFDNEDLKSRLERKSLFCNKSCKKAKGLIEDHKDIKVNKPHIDNLSFVTNDIEMAFVTKLGETIKVTPRTRTILLPKALAKQGSLSNFISKIK